MLKFSSSVGVDLAFTAWRSPSPRGGCRTSLPRSRPRRSPSSTRKMVDRRRDYPPALVERSHGTSRCPPSEYIRALFEPEASYAAWFPLACDSVGLAIESLEAACRMAVVGLDVRLEGAQALDLRGTRLALVLRPDRDVTRLARASSPTSSASHVPGRAASSAIRSADKRVASALLDLPVTLEPRTSSCSISSRRSAPRADVLEADCDLLEQLVVALSE